ncbi:MAG: LpqB family beta-propeller domain-containing protein [Anaerolineae bacterium]
MNDLSGQVLRGYELQQLIGEGGFGAVYRAFQPIIGREVAVKVILPEHANQPEFVRRFESEAQVVARLEHPHIVPLFDYWRDPGGAYLVMRWLRGGSLRSLLDRGRLDIKDTLRIVDQIAAGLYVAHRNGVVHRDLKPDNILLDDDRNAYLADFGIAKTLVSDPEKEKEKSAAEEEGIVGSPAYIAPEQIMTEPVTPQTDIYSMGVMLYEMVAGKHAFEGSPASTMIMKHLSEPLPAIHEVRQDLPEVLNTVIQKATAKTPSLRYANVLALAAEFRRALSTVALDSLPPEATQDETSGSMDAAALARLGITEEFMSSEFEGIEPENPYKGLRAFEEADADDFFGREALTERLLKRLDGENERFLAVIGPSGSGKSSVIKAGILPALRRGALLGSSDWFVVEMAPGSQPVQELADALLRVAVKPPEHLLETLSTDEHGLARVVEQILPPAANSEATSELVLLIDQFEEIFTQVEDENTRALFLDSLRTAVQTPSSRLRLIVTMRADFYDRPLLYPEFGELVREHTEVVLPLSNEELERAISLPAENSGLGLEVGLVTSIVTDVAEQPGALPLLQYALTELFERRDGRWLTVESYKNIGGVSGALAKRADDLYNELDSAGKKAARQMFLRLVTLGEGAEDTRRRVRQTELTSLDGSQAMQQVINLFGKYRLLTFDRDPITRVPTIELAHEALIRKWGRLRAWLTDNREALRLQRRLGSATEEWLNANRDASFLASGTRLEQFEAFDALQSDIALTQEEDQYLRDSLTRREHERAEEAARAAREKATEARSRQRLRLLVAVMTAAAVIAGVLSLLAFNQSQIAQNNAATATNAQGEALFQAGTATVAQGEALIQQDNAATAAAVAQANEVQARSLAFVSGAQLALSNNNPDLAILLALEANRTGIPSVQTLNTLAAAAYAPGTRRIYNGHDSRVTSVQYSPDGTRAISGSRGNTLILWNVASGQIIREFPQDDPNTAAVEGHRDWVWDVAFSPDGTRVLSASADGTLILWNVETGEIVQQFVGHSASVRCVAFNTDGTKAISGSEDSTLMLWDTDESSGTFGQAIRTLSGHSDVVNAVAFSSSGFTVLSGSQDGSAILWNLNSGQPLFTLRENEQDAASSDNAVWSVAYAPGESGAITGENDSELTLWSFETGQPVRSYQGHSARITRIALSPDGTRMATTSEDTSIILWDVQTGAVVYRYLGHTFPVYGLDFSPDGRNILSASWDGTLRLWDVDNGAQILAVNQGTEVLSVDYSPTAHQALSGLEDGSIVLWNTDTGEEIRRLQGHSAAVNTVRFNHDGTRALSGAEDYSVILWNVETGEIIHQMGGLDSVDGHSNGVLSVAFSPDESRAVSGSKDNTLIIWDLATGAQLNRLFGHTFHVTGVAYSPDGTMIVSSSRDTLLILWDAENGQEIRRFQGHGDWVLSVAFSPDGQQLVSSSSDNTVMLWDVSSGTRLRTFEGHTAQVFDVAYSPNGQYLISAGGDRLVILWDVASGSELQRFVGHTNDVRSVAFNADGSEAISSSGDGTVRLWRILTTSEALVSWIEQNRYVRELTCQERERFGVPPLCPTPTPVN